MATRNFILSLAAASLTISFAACSNDSEPAKIDSSKAIRFAVQSKSMTRSETTTANLTEFAVYGYTNGGAFMENVDVKKTAQNTWEYSPVVYWPGTPVNFYAFSPVYWDDYAEDNSVPPATSNVVNPSTPVSYYSQWGNTDLIYAVSMGLKDTTAPVLLNFRHALSKISIELQTQVADMFNIEIIGVNVHGVKTTGTFTFPSVTTAASDTSADSKGSWSKLSGDADYMFYTTNLGGSEMTYLTSSPQSANQISQGFLVPQPLGTYSISGTGSDQTITGDYISVDCRIYNKESGQQVWPNETTPPIEMVTDITAPQNTGRIYFPLAADNVTEWLPGVNYIYTINVGSPDNLNEIVFGNPTVDTYSTVVPVTP